MCYLEFLQLEFSLQAMLFLLVFSPVAPSAIEIRGLESPTALVDCIFLSSTLSFLWHAFCSCFGRQWLILNLNGLNTLVQKYIWEVGVLC